MVRRHPASRFVADSYVFPGGCLDEDDCSDEMEGFCTGLDQKHARLVIRDMVPPEFSLAAWIAGIRETFEEVGILMAYDWRGCPVSLESGEIRERISGYRKELYTGRMKFQDILRKEKLTLSTDRLHYYSHWITPEPLPLRYDVRFFVAEAPQNQKALHDGFELTDHVWITPQEALVSYREKRFNMVLPTIMTMKELCNFDKVDEVILSTRDKQIPAILTRMVRKGKEFVEIMPDGSIFGPSPVR